jgi:hemerythrin-like domain-containing protein
MRPTQELIAEHDAVLLALRVLERVEAGLAGEASRATEDLDQLLGFFRGFVDACHHAKEEEVLFPELERRGVGRERGPIGVMLTEHARGRELVRGMAEGLERLRSGESGAAAAIANGAQQYRALLEAHIFKENNVLFPMADRLVPDEAAATIAARFEAIERERIGAGKHEAYHMMLQRLSGAYEIA